MGFIKKKDIRVTFIDVYDDYYHQVLPIAIIPLTLSFSRHPFVLGKFYRRHPVSAELICVNFSKSANTDVFMFMNLFLLFWYVLLVFFL